MGFERAQVAALLRQARSRLVDLDQAQARLRAGVYGVCVRCEHRIALERLMAHPGGADLCRWAAGGRGQGSKGPLPI